MSYRILNDIRAPIDRPETEVLDRARKELHLPQTADLFVYRRSLDTRKDKFSFVYSIAVESDISDPRLKPFPQYELPEPIKSGKTVPIVGFGPAGMFCAWLLAKCGARPYVIERGSSVEQRVRHVEAFWNGGELNPESNVQFGEGGAGTFSDGKLTTRINDERCRTILELLVFFGADPDILKLAKPHIGTDRLREVVQNLRKEVISMGGEVHFDTKLTDLKIENGRLQALKIEERWIETDVAVLAIGNGARDTYQQLLEKPLLIEPKPFSVGFRAEHDQEALNRRIYGKHYGASILGAADYQFSHVTDKTRNEAVYTFCMCPGGTVVNASSLQGALTTNGMSTSKRDGSNANAAILASVRPDTVREGLELQETIEQAAFRVANGLGPATTGRAFLNQEHPGKTFPICPTFSPGTEPYDINQLFPAEISTRLREGFAKFRDKILGDEPSVLTAPETRTSAPLRILRDPVTLEASTCRGLYPCGEGAGYAGGIMSSAVDGFRVAEQILRSLQ